MQSAWLPGGGLWPSCWRRHVTHPVDEPQLSHPEAAAHHAIIAPGHLPSQPMHTQVWGWALGDQLAQLLHLHAPETWNTNANNKDMPASTKNPAYGLHHVRVPPPALFSMGACSSFEPQSCLSSELHVAALKAHEIPHSAQQ